VVVRAVGAVEVLWQRGRIGRSVTPEVWPCLLITRRSQPVAATAGSACCLAGGLVPALTDGSDLLGALALARDRLAGSGGLRTSWPTSARMRRRKLGLFAFRAFGSKFRAITRAITHGQTGIFTATRGRSPDGGVARWTDKTAGQTRSDLRWEWWPGAGSNRRPSDFQAHRQLQGLVAKTATVSVHGNTYEVDAALDGRRHRHRPGLMLRLDTTSKG